MNYFLAIDIGASSGRHIIGFENGGKLETIEIHRFYNGVKKENEHLIWDIDYLLQEVKNGIKKALKEYPSIKSMSIDTWGVDYVLLDEFNKEIYPVYAYRDNRTEKIIPKVHEIISFDTLYNKTGCQFQPFNTIYQLYADKCSGRLDKARNYLMIPEYLMYKLTNVMAHEITNASTMGLLNLKTRSYDEEIIEKLGLKKELFIPLSNPSTNLGYFTKEVEEEVGGNILVSLCATHDTGSAVEAVEIKKNSVYISSGTWSLLGVKLQEGISTKESLKANYSNEYGPNYFRYQKNIMGLWIIQGLAKELNKGFAEMVELSKSSSYELVFDVNDNVFLSSLHMKETIKNWYKEHDMNPPVTEADYIYATYHSLAVSYAQALNELEQITKVKYSAIYIVGGGAKNTYLNYLTGVATGKEIIALPIEATAIGNLKSQMKVRN